MAKKGVTVTCNCKDTGCKTKITVSEEDYAEAEEKDLPILHEDHETVRGDQTVKVVNGVRIVRQGR